MRHCSTCPAKHCPASFRRFGLAELDDASLRDPLLLALAQPVTYEVDAEFPKYYGGEVVARLASGADVRVREAVNRGHAERPLTSDDIIAKFMENAAVTGSRERAERVRDVVLGLDGLANVAVLADELADSAHREPSA